MWLIFGILDRAGMGAKIWFWEIFPNLSFPSLKSSISLPFLQCLSDNLKISSKERTDLEKFLKIRFLPPCRPYRKFQKSAIFGQKIFKAKILSPCLFYNAWATFWRFQARKGQIWKNFSKSDFCPHAGPIENSKNQPYLVKKIFKLKSYLLVFSTMPER